MRLFLVWDSETISEQTDSVVESLFEAIDGGSSSESGDGGGKKRKKSSKKKSKKDSSSSSSSRDESSSESEEPETIVHPWIQIMFLFCSYIRMSKTYDQWLRPMQPSRDIP